MYIQLKDVKNKNFIGPWLFNEECLLKMDEILDTTYKQLIASENEKRATNSFLSAFEKKKYVEITYRSGNKKQYDSFEAAIYDNEYKNDLAISFEYSLVVKYNSLQLSVKRNDKNISYLECFGNISESQINSRCVHSINKLLQKEWPSFFRQIAHLIGWQSWILLGIILLLEPFYQ